MASYSYDISTDTITVTGAGGSFADLHTADQAGSVTLLSTASPALAVTLTYPVQPAKQLALLLDFVVSGKTAETDYIYITGKDAWGNTQTESIDIAAGNGTYTTTKKFSEITSFDCSDNSGGGGNAWADGTVSVLQNQWGVTEEHETNYDYTIRAHLKIGNNNDTTFFESLNEQVYFIDGVYWWLDKATLSLGEESAGGSAINGSLWDFGPSDISPTTGYSSYHWLTNNASTLNLYNSRLHLRTAVRHYWAANSAGDIHKSKFSGPSAAYGYNYFLLDGSLDINGLSVAAMSRLEFGNISGTMLDVSVHNTYRATGTPYGFTDITLKNFTISDIVELVFYNGASTASMSLIDSTLVPVSSLRPTAGFVWRDSYSLNLKVTDEAGNAIEGATVTLANDAGVGGNAFAVSTDVNGDIAEQIVLVRHLTGTGTSTDPTEVAYGPFALTISKNGYETYTQADITLSEAVNWPISLTPRQKGNSNQNQSLLGSPITGGF